MPWRALNEFAGTPLGSIDPHTQRTTLAEPGALIPPPANWRPRMSGAAVLPTGGDRHLVTAAMEERADAMAEILSQSDEFISYFLNMMTARPGGLSKDDQGARDRQSGGHLRRDVLQGTLRAPAAVAALSGTAAADRGARTRLVPQRPLDAGAPDGAVHGQRARYGCRSSRRWKTICGRWPIALPEPRNSGPALSQRYHRGHGDRAIIMPLLASTTTFAAALSDVKAGACATA